MSIGSIIFLSIIGLVTLAAMLFMVRTTWVYRVRMRVLKNPDRTSSERLDDYDLLPSYDAMVARFWIWDVEKFKDERNRSNSVLFADLDRRLQQANSAQTVKNPDSHDHPKIH